MSARRLDLLQALESYASAGQYPRHQAGPLQRHSRRGVFGVQQVCHECDGGIKLWVPIGNRSELTHPTATVRTSPVPSCTPRRVQSPTPHVRTVALAGTPRARQRALEDAMLRTEPVSAVMTRDPIAVQRDAAPSAVRALIRDHAFHHVPVVDGEIVVGMLSSVDLAAFSLEAWGVDAQTVDAELDASFDLDRLMSHDVVSVRADDTLQRATELLSEGHIHALPVIDGERRLVGMITSTDLLRYLYSGG